MDNIVEFKEYETDFFKKFKDFRQAGHKKNVFTIDWNCKGTFLATADSTIKIWKCKANSLLKEVEYSKAHNEAVECLSWHPKDSHILASSSKDGAIKLWDIRQKNNIKSFKTKIENYCLCWNIDGTQFAFTNKDNVLSFYDYKQLKMKDQLKMNMDTSDFVWDPSGSVILVTGTQKNIGILQVLDGNNPQLPPLETIECHRAGINCIQVDQQGKYFATAANDALVCLWDLYEMVCIRTFDHLQEIIKKISFSQDGKYLATASEDAFIDIYNTEKGWLSYRIKGVGSQNAIKWNPKSNILAFVGEDKEANEESVIHLYGMPNSSN